MTRSGGSVDLLIVSPGLLEPASSRGGGIEEVDYEVALRLAKSMRILLVGPKLVGSNRNDPSIEGLRIARIPFPAVPNYPPLSRYEETLSFFALFPYSLILGIWIISIMVFNRVQVVIVHNGPPGLCAALIAVILGRTLVYSEGNSYPWYRPYLEQPKRSVAQRVTFIFHRTTGRLLGLLCDVVRVQDSLIAEGMINAGIIGEKVVVIPGGVNTDSIEPRVHDRDSVERVQIGFIGRLSDEKGAPVLCKVVELAQTRLPDVRFIILGRGPYEARLRSMPNVESLKWIPRSDLGKWLSIMDIVISIQKAIGLAEIQALAAGKIVVAADYDGVSMHIHHMQNGVLCKPNPQSYVDALEMLLKNRELQKEICRKARETALETFSWDTVAQSWRRMLERFLVHDS